MSKKYLVTGGAGFLGSHLCKTLINMGNEVVCMDDLSTGIRSNIKDLESNKSFTFAQHDLTKPFFPEQIDGIFNLACPASPVHYQFNPIRTLKMGTLAIYNVLGMASRLGIPVLQASTSEIYGDPIEYPQNESYWGNVNPFGPRACYDEGKRVAEALFYSYNRHSGTDIRIARIFNTYGPNMVSNDGRVVSNFFVQLLNNEPLTVYGDGKQTRSFCFVEDLISGLIKLMNSGFQEPVNLGNLNEITINELVRVIGKISGKKPEVINKELPVNDPQRRCPDISLARKLLNWEPNIKLEDGLIQTYKWFKKANKNENAN